MTSKIPPRSRTREGAAYIAAGAGEPLVLLHGVGLRLEAWGPQIAALSASHRVIALDLPGHGESAPLPPGSRLPDFVAWLGRALDSVGCGPASVAGHSMGALIALGAALEFPDRIRRVALICGVGPRSAAAREAVAARARQIAEGARDIEGPLARWFGDEDSPERRACCDWLSSVDPDAYATAYRAFAEGDALYAGRIGALACPALFLTGEGDLNSTPAMAQAMAEATLNGRAVVVPGHRHMVGMTAPEAVNAALRDWLAVTPSDREDAA